MGVGQEDDGFCVGGEFESAGCDVSAEQRKPFVGTAGALNEIQHFPGRRKLGLVLGVLRAIAADFVFVRVGRGIPRAKGNFGTGHNADVGASAGPRADVDVTLHCLVECVLRGLSMHAAIGGQCVIRRVNGRSV